jgi:hypothetical protein
MATNSTKVSFKFAGVSMGNAASDIFHDMQLKVHYLEVYNDAGHVFAQANLSSSVLAKVNYQTLVNAANFSSSPILLNYYEDVATQNIYGMGEADGGIYPLGSQQQSTAVSIYRREYAKYQRKGSSGTVETSTVTGEWEPVSYGGIGTHVRDMNVQSGHSYQYVAYPSSIDNAEVNGASTEDGGSVVRMGFPCWSLTELQEVTSDLADTPTIKKVYKADLANVWLLKFALETGATAQNVARSEIQTLGMYPRYSQGLLNAASGSISCYLGSEVIPYDAEGGYIERLWSGIDDPSAVPLTNPGVAMLRAWKLFAYSKNPKLLKDMKGDSWIVQIESPSTTPSNYIYGQPTQISFTWKQVASRDSAIIYADGTTVLPTLNEAGSRWAPVS